jgi:hypothetical protein
MRQGPHTPGAARDDGLRRLSRLTWRATQLSAITAVGFVAVFARTASAHTVSAPEPAVRPSPHATPSPRPSQTKSLAHHGKHRLRSHAAAAAPGSTPTPGSAPTSGSTPAPTAGTTSPPAPAPTHTTAPAPPPTTPAPAPAPSPTHTTSSGSTPSGG